MRKIVKNTLFILALVIGMLLASQMVSMGVSEGPVKCYDENGNEVACPAPRAPDESGFCAIIIAN